MYSEQPAEHCPYPYHLHFSMSKQFASGGVDVAASKWLRVGGAALVWAAASSSVACRHDPGPAGEDVGCTKDSDCKGDRICQDGQCIDPIEPSALSGHAALPPSPSDAWRRGGPAGDRPFAGKGPQKAPKMAWEVDLGAVVFARPTVLGSGDASIAYVGTHAGRFVGVVTDGEAAGEIRVDLTLGGMIWGTAIADAAGRLYVGADDDQLYAIDPAAGKIAWQVQLGDCKPTRSPGPEGARCDVDGGPTIGPDGDLYVGAAGVYRVGKDGKVRWHYPQNEVKPPHVFSTPMVTKEGLVVFGGQDGFVTALEAETGAPKWRYKVRADVDGSAALGIDGTVYIGADDGRLYALRGDGSLRWSFVAQKDIRSSIAVANDGAVFATSFDGNLYSLDPAGNVRWVLPTGGRIASSPVIDGAGVVYFGSQDDRLYAVEGDGKVRWAIDFPADIDGSVAITGEGTIVIGADDGKLRGLR